jgi:hypothetical protein
MIDDSTDFQDLASSYNLDKRFREEKEKKLKKGKLEYNISSKGGRA